METQSWLKLWRKTKDNDIFIHDPTAWHIFEYLLMTVDYKTGQWNTGRFIIALALFIKPCTVYAALKRLEKAKMITQASNNKYTTISICNWSEYQLVNNNESNNQIITEYKPNNNQITLIKNIRNKEIKKKEIIYTETDVSLTEKLYELVKINYPFVKDKANKQKDYEEMNRLNRLGGYTYQQIEFIIKWSQQDEFWKQNIRSVSKLREKFEELVVRVKNKVDKRKVVNYDE
jgi:hypothetical protein